MNFKLPATLLATMPLWTALRARSDASANGETAPNFRHTAKAAQRMASDSDAMRAVTDHRPTDAHAARVAAPFFAGSHVRRDRGLRASWSPRRWAPFYTAGAGVTMRLLCPMSDPECKAGSMTAPRDAPRPWE